MADDGKGTGEGNGAASEEVQQLADLKSEMGTLKQEGITLKEAKEDLERKLDDADKELLSEDYLSFKEGKGKGKEEGEKGEEGDVDFDRASNREIVSFIEKKHKGDLKAAAEELGKRVERTEQSLQMALAHIDVQLTTMRHNGADGKVGFADNQKAILEIAKKNPSWGAEKCYQQFILESKAEVDAAAEKKKKEAEEEDKATAEKSGVPATVTQEKDLNADEAAEKAYRVAFGSEK